jgi:mRNA interferase MazF
MIKDFENWHRLKTALDDNIDRPSFQQRQVWWCHLGLNVGDEENGKGQSFSRPVLVLRKYNNKIFLGVPLTTKIKESPHYLKIHFREKEQCAMVSQLRVWDSKRMINLMGKLAVSQFNLVRESIKNSV